jgi:hypothetical protein
MKLLVVAAVIGVIAAAGAITAPATVGTPRLVVATLHPFAVRGTQFRPRELVRVSVVTGAATGVRSVRASRAGTFRISLPTVELAACPWYVVRAVGNRGSHARARLMPECPNGPAP